MVLSHCTMQRLSIFLIMTFIVTMVERHSRFLDRGAEMTKHVLFTVATDIQVYFFDPQSPWRREAGTHTLSV